uniref:SKP1 component POZ domain-containing protein n=1 Tax=Spermophilus dauricus TaxID=99837 RepID=A0A8C9QHU6_SPEDA
MAHRLDGRKKSYGGCEGCDAMYIKLISSDSHKFIIKREYALTSGTITAMLSEPVQLWKMKPSESILEQSLHMCY